MIYVRYDTQSETGLQTWIDKLGDLIHVSISVFDPQFRLIVTTGGTDTEEQAKEWHETHKRITSHYPNIRLLPDKTAEVIGEVVSDTTPIAYIVVSRFYFDEDANPHTPQFINELPVYDEYLAKDVLLLISIGVRTCLRELVVIDPAFSGKLDEYTRLHLNENLTLQSISRALHTDINSLRIFLQATFNCNLPNYLRKVRLEEAKRLLATTDFSYGEIAEKIGIEEERWTVLFKKQVSMSPEEYRKTNRH